MSIVDFLKKRKNVVYQESAGINSAIHLIDEFRDRTFTFKGLKKKYFGLTGEDLLKRIKQEMDSMLILYRYTTKIKTYIDRKGTSHAEITLLGQAGMMSRYNLLNVELHVKTEMPEK